MIAALFTSPIFARVIPFAAFMAFIALDQGLGALARWQILALDARFFAWLYLPKAIVVALLLILYRRYYAEIRWKDLLALRKTALSIALGLLTFVLWINMDWTLGSQPPPAGFNPEVFRSEPARWLMVAVRLAGGVIIVPIMEELFWRSFLLRYLIDNDFTRVAVGRFSLLSFAAVSLLFGLEHHYLFAGIMAGMIFNATCYATRSIAQCMLAHAVANLCLAGYVLATGHWHFW